VHDRQSGQTSRVSVASDGSQANDDSFNAMLSADGRYVAFSSEATNLVAGDTNAAEDIFIHDRQTGQTSRVSVATGGVQANDLSRDVTLSADGRFVAFGSWATNLVPNDTNGAAEVFVHDRQTGQTTRVAVASDGAEANSFSFEPHLSADGRLVAFFSDATNLAPGDNGFYGDVFIHDRQTGKTSRLSIASDGGNANAMSSGPILSADGRRVVFISAASNLIVGDTNIYADIYALDRGW
jgi:Tol biopolymer transport system component